MFWSHWAARSRSSPRARPSRSWRAPPSIWPNPWLTAASRFESRAGSSGAVEPSGWVAERTSVMNSCRASIRLTWSSQARPDDFVKSSSACTTTVSGATAPWPNFFATSRRALADAVSLGISSSVSLVNSVRVARTANGSISSRPIDQLKRGRRRIRWANRSQNPDDGRVIPRNDFGVQRARRTSMAGARVRVAASVMTSPSATLGPVRENSLNRVVPINISPTQTVPGARQECPSRAAERHPHRPGGVLRVPVLGVPPRDEEAEIRPAPEQEDHQEQLDQRRDLPEPRGGEPRQDPARDDQADPDRDQRDERQAERPVDRQEDPEEQDHRGQRRAVERLLDVPHVVAADGGVARPVDRQAGGPLQRRVVGYALEPGNGHLARRRDERGRERDHDELQGLVRADQPGGDLRRGRGPDDAEHLARLADPVGEPAGQPGGEGAVGLGQPRLALERDDDLRLVALVGPRLADDLRAEGALGPFVDQVRLALGRQPRQVGGEGEHPRRHDRPGGHDPEGLQRHEFADRVIPH